MPRASLLLLALLLGLMPALTHAQPAGADLLDAVRRGDLPGMRAALDQGADPQATDGWRRTPLLVATQLRNVAAVRLLLERRADVDAANRNDITPLIAAAQTGQLEIAALLLRAGAQADRADNLGWTALRWATYRRDEAMIRLLQAHGASEAAAPAVPPAALSDGTVPATPSADPSRAVRGHPAAPITLYEYTDFQCPYCAQGAKSVAAVLARYESQVRLVLKHLPLPSLHPMAMASAAYFEALALQSPDLAWTFHDRLFADQRMLSGGEAALRNLAGAIGADLARLAADLEGDVVRARIEADLAEAKRFGFDGVPAFVINGHVLTGAQPPERFYALIDALIGPRRPGR